MAGKEIEEMEYLLELRRYYKNRSIDISPIAVRSHK